MATNSNNGYSERLDRIEGIIEAVATAQADVEQEHKRLLTAQILLVEAQRKTDEQLGKVATAMAQVAETQKHTDERMDALIATVDDIIRGKK